MVSHAGFQKAVDHYADPRWRLNNLYWITDKAGKRIKFEMNWAQEALFKHMHFQNLILKARQLGFTTFIQLFLLDQCVFNSNVRAGTVAHTLDDAKVIFRDKIKYPYESLPEVIQEQVRANKDTANELLFSNNSSIRVGTSLRSGTLQLLHISEYGKICAKYPEKAREIKTGALNTVEQGQIVFIESTAEGQEGHFFEMCAAAQAKQRMASRLTPLDFKFHFFPWWKNHGYALDPAGVVIPPTVEDYFAKLQAVHGVALTAAQKAWYVKKAETQEDDIKREYPATPEEAFEAAVEGAYYAVQMAKVESDGRICHVPYEPSLPVETAWDIGMNDNTAIWFFQRFLREIRLIDHYSNSDEGLSHYVDVLERKPYKYGAAWVPHDIKVREWLADGKTRIAAMIEKGLKPKLIPAHAIADRIHATRQTLARCVFDEEKTADGVKSLKSYRKEWDDERGIWKDKPRHDQASHDADSFGGLCIAAQEQKVKKIEKKIPRGIGVNQPNQITVDELWALHEQDKGRSWM